MTGPLTGKRLLITGASGFIGRACLARLAGAAYDEIHAVNRSGAGPGGARVRWHAADLRDPGAAAALIAALRPSHLLHGAWIATPGLYSSAPENLDWLAGALALARAFGECGGVRLVGIGSSAEYQPGAELCREDETPIRPASLYGACKAAGWQAIQAVARHHGFSAAWGRLFLPYGPGDAPQRLIPSLVAALRACQTIETTEGRQQRDFILAADAADLFARLLESDEAGTFNVGTGDGVAVRAVIERLADRFQARALLRFGARPMAPGEPMQLVADMSRVRRRLGWSAPTPLAEGLERTLDDLTARA